MKSKYRNKNHAHVVRLLAKMFADIHTDKAQIAHSEFMASTTDETNVCLKVRLNNGKEWLIGTSQLPVEQTFPAAIPE